MENEDTTVQETHYTTSTAPQSLPTQMFCIKEMKSGT
uniref:Uncharacterized protein n=1 Tax=Anguilla anguilla TaxID=7936 RepID=A0A0E9W746_ANGAN